MIFKDDFNRPDAPDLGASWAGITGPGFGGSPAIRSNRVGANSTDFTYYRALYNAGALPDNQFAQFVLADLSGIFEASLLLRGILPPAPQNQYDIAIQVVPDSYFVFGRYVNGAFTVLTGNIPVSPAFASGDVIRAEAVKNEIRLFRNGKLLHKLTDTAIPTGSYAGLSLATNSLATALDDFQAGPVGSFTEQIIHAIVAALDGAGKPAGVTVNRSRRQSIEQGQLPMISVYPIREEVESVTDSRRSPLVGRQLRVQVKCRIAGDDQANDLLRNWAVKAVMADQSLGGLSLEISEESTDWDAEDASDGDYSVAAVDLLVRYTTSRFDLESKT